MRKTIATIALTGVIMTMAYGHKYPNESIANTLENTIESTSVNKSVAYHYDNVGEKSNIKTDELKLVLENINDNKLVKYADTFIKAEEEYSINAFVMVAIVAHESGWGKSKRAKEQNNLTGYAVFNSNAKGKTFDNGSESIMKTAKLLRENYLTPGAPNFNGTSINAINIDYCLTEDSSKTDFGWSESIHTISEELEDIYLELYKKNISNKVE